MEVIKFEGSVSLQKLLACIKLDDPSSCTHRLRWLLDFDGAVFNIDGQQARKLAEITRFYRQSTGCHGERCIVSVYASDDLTYGNMRMLQVYLEDVLEMHVFRDRDDAVNSLNHPKTQLCA